MRLIDADALIKRFEGLRDEHETNCISYVALYEVLVAQPTAYDVEKVVAELEGSVEKIKIEGKLDYISALFKISAYVDAIDIVRKGGIDGQKRI